MIPVFSIPLDQITTIEQCDQERDFLLDSIANLEVKISIAKARASKTGEYADPRVFHGWIKLCRKRREGLQRIQEIRGRINRDSRRAHSTSEDKEIIMKPTWYSAETTIFGPSHKEGTFSGFVKYDLRMWTFGVRIEPDDCWFDANFDLGPFSFIYWRHGAVRKMLETQG